MVVVYRCISAYETHQKMRRSSSQQSFRQGIVRYRTTITSLMPFRACVHINYSSPCQCIYFRPSFS